MSWRWLPLLATACGAPLYFPLEPPENGGFDTANPGEPFVPCSGHGTVAVTLTVSNLRADTVDVFWKSYGPDCGETLYMELPAGGSYDQQSANRDVWVVRDTAGTYLTHLVLDDSPTQTLEIR